MNNLEANKEKMKDKHFLKWYRTLSKTSKYAIRSIITAWKDLQSYINSNDFK